MNSRTSAAISLSPDGFVTTYGATVSWVDVVEVNAYKEDWWTTDEICLGFRSKDNAGHDWVNESAGAYQDLLSSLPGIFPGIRTDWFSEVAFPAFEENRTVLWSRNA